MRRPPSASPPSPWPQRPPPAPPPAPRPPPPPPPSPPPPADPAAPPARHADPAPARAPGRDHRRPATQGPPWPLRRAHLLRPHRPPRDGGGRRAQRRPADRQRPHARATRRLQARDRQAHLPRQPAAAPQLDEAAAGEGPRPRRPPGAALEDADDQAVGATGSRGSARAPTA